MFLPFDIALQKLLCLFGTMCKMYGSKFHMISFVIICDVVLAPSMHTFSVIQLVMDIASLRCLSSLIRASV